MAGMKKGTRQSPRVTIWRQVVTFRILNDLRRQRLR